MTTPSNPMEEFRREASNILTDAIESRGADEPEYYGEELARLTRAATQLVVRELERLPLTSGVRGYQFVDLDDLDELSARYQAILNGEEIE